MHDLYLYNNAPSSFFISFQSSLSNNTHFFSFSGRVLTDLENK